MIAGIARTWINSRISSVLPNFSEHREAFVFSNIEHSNLDETYHLEIISLAGTPKDDQVAEDTLSATVRLFREGFNDVTASADSLFDDSHCLKMDLINPVNLNSHPHIKDVNLLGVSLSPILGNESVAVAEINIELRMFFDFV